MAAILWAPACALVAPSGGPGDDPATKRLVIVSSTGVPAAAAMLQKQQENRLALHEGAWAVAVQSPRKLLHLLVALSSASVLSRSHTAHSLLAFGVRLQI